MLDMRSLEFASSQFRTILWRQNAGFEATCLGSTKLLLLDMSSWKEQRSIWTIVCGENVNRKYSGVWTENNPEIRALGAITRKLDRGLGPPWAHKSREDIGPGPDTSGYGRTWYPSYVGPTSHEKELPASPRKRMRGPPLSSFSATTGSFGVSIFRQMTKIEFDRCLESTRIPSTTVTVHYPTQ